MRTIRERALWPPYVAAKAILAEANGTATVTPGGQPADLLPGSGQYPLEGAYYSSFVLADIDDTADGTRTALEDADPIRPGWPARSERWSVGRCSGT